MKKHIGQKRVTRRWSYRELDAADRILSIYDELCIHSGWRGARRALFYVLLVRWTHLAKHIPMTDITEP